MKKIFLLLAGIIFSCCVTQAQMPHGKLYLRDRYLNTNKLSYIQYPEGYYRQFDSLRIGNVFAINGKLYVCENEDPGDRLFGNLWEDWYHGKNIYVYDMMTDKRIDSIPIADPVLIMPWRDKFIIASDEKPRLRVFDTNSFSAPLWTVDTTQIEWRINDILINNDTAYIAGDSAAYVFDLLERKVIFRYGIPRGGIASFVIEAGGKIYLDVAHGWNVTNASFFRFNLPKNKMDTLVLTKIAPYDSYSPIVTKDEILLFMNSYIFDYARDTLYVTEHNSYKYFAISYDKNSHSYFSPYGNVSDKDPKLWTDTIIVTQNETVISRTVIPLGMRRALFVPGEFPPVSVQPESKENFSFEKISPNIYSIKNSSEEKFSLELYSILGEKILSREFSSDVALDLNAFTKGLYLVKIQDRKENFFRKVIVE